MMVTALLMRPWIMQMKALVMNTRMLADDMQLVSVGPTPLENFTDAVDETYTHVVAMWAKLVTHKSLTFSSNEASRKWLRRHRWGRIGRTIPVIVDARDLGAHLNTLEGRKRAATLSDRMRQTTTGVEYSGPRALGRAGLRRRRRAPRGDGPAGE